MPWTADRSPGRRSDARSDDWGTYGLRPMCVGHVGSSTMDLPGGQDNRGRPFLCREASMLTLDPDSVCATLPDCLLAIRA